MTGNIPTNDTISDDELLAEFEADINRDLADDEFIAYKLEVVIRAEALLTIPNLDETLRFHLQRFVELTRKECRERKILKGQDSYDFDDTDNYLRNTYISSPGEHENDVHTVLSLIKGREYSEFVPTAVKPFGSVVRIFKHNLMGILDY